MFRNFKTIFARDDAHPTKLMDAGVQDVDRRVLTLIPTPDGKLLPG